MDRALLVGINRYPDAPLRQCVRDIERSLDGIQRMFAFDPRGIRLLCDGRATTENILTRLHWLVAGAKAGDRLLFHYSGHGTQVASRAGSGEVDGLDEVICPVDFDWENKHLIRDKQFSEIFASVPARVEFVWISDSCHSGDLQRDLRTRCRYLPPPLDIAFRNTLARLRIGRGMHAAAQRLNVALVSACADHETAAETDDGGALTSALWTALEKTPRASLAKIMGKVAKAVHGQSPRLAGASEICRAPFMARLG